MFMSKKLPKDYLMDNTERALRDAIFLSKERGRLWPIVVYGVGGDIRSFPSDFDDFVAEIEVAERQPNPQRLMHTMGAEFLFMGITLRATARQPDRLAEHRKQWDATVRGMLRMIRPQYVVLIIGHKAGLLGISDQAPMAPVLVAIGLHPAKRLRLAAVREPGMGPIEFGPIVEVDGGSIHALGNEWYRAIYGPGES